MNILIMQAEIAKDLIETNGATTTGVVLAFSAVLIIALGVLWKSLEKKNQYIIEQDKANLTMLMELTATIKTMGKDVENIDNNTRASDNKIDNLIRMIEQRLNSSK